MDDSVHSMKADRFVALWNRCARFDDPDCGDIYRALKERYGESHRIYHTGNHICHCLAGFDSIDTDLAQTSKDIIELSIWFHDAIYDIAASDNEAQSARWFSSLADNKLNPDIIDAVNRCILFTTHQDKPADQCSLYMVDVDLSGFGQDWEGFSADGRKIREENNHLDDEAFVDGQVKFMNRLLNRSCIFYTEYFNTRLENRARQNIIRQLEIYR